MPRFLLKVLLLTGVPLALVGAVAPSRALESVRAISPLRYQVYRAATLGDTIRAVAIGDSHAALGFRSPDASIYSLAFPGENLAELVLKTRFASRALPHVEAVFVQAQPHMFFPHRAGVPREEHRLLFTDPQGSPSPAPLSLMFDPCCRGEIPGIALKSFFGIPVGLPIPEIGPTGFSMYPPSLRHRGDLAADARREVASYGESVANQDLRRLFADMVAELRRRRIDVVLTRYPLSPDYRAALGEQPFADADRFFRSLQQQFGAKSCGAWDALTDRSMFFNSDHLSPDAAARYWTQVLAPCLANSAVGIEADRG